MAATVADAAWRPQDYFSYDIASASAAAHFNENAGFPSEIQVRRGTTPDFRPEGGCTHTMSLWCARSDSGLFTVPRSQADVVVFRFVTSGRAVRRDHRHEYVGDPGHAMFVSLDEMMSEEASPHYSAFGGTIARATLQAAHEALEGGLARPLLRCEPMAPAMTPAMNAFMLSVRRLHRRIALLKNTNDLLFSILEEVLSYQLLSCWPLQHARAEVRQDSSDPRYVSRARDYIEGHLATPLTLFEVAASAGISVRSLQSAFKHEMNMTPLGFIIERRLEEVHRELASEENRNVSIATIAQRWGFRHMGDFTQRYRTRFGCTPGRTPGHRG